MKVFFSCTTYQFEKYRDLYLGIRDLILSEGHVITHDWLARFVNGSPGEDRSMPPEEYSKILSGVKEADVLIFENTLPSFSTGHLLTLGLEQKKRTLVMWLDDSPWTKRMGFIEQISSEYLGITEYNRGNYASVLKQFLNKYSQSNSRYRFNLVIDDAEKSYLEWANYKGFKSRTRIIRDLIRDKMNSDKEYGKYIESRR